MLDKFDDFHDAFIECLYFADCGADVVGLDWTMDIGQVRDAIGHKVALQGNLDPSVLYMSREDIAACCNARRRARRPLRALCGGGARVAGAAEPTQQLLRSSARWADASARDVVHG